MANEGDRKGRSGSNFAWPYIVAFIVLLLVVAIINVSSDYHKAQFLRACIHDSPADYCGKIWDGVK